MSPEILLYVLVGWQPLPYCHTPGFPYPQLPTEAVCTCCYQQCNIDQQEIAAQLQIVGGWQRSKLLEHKGKIDRLTAAWYAAWWVTWSRATPEQREEWVDILIGHIGMDAFWRGEIPLPLGCH